MPLPTGMLAASIVGCSKSSSGEAGSSAETSTADSGKQAAETGLNPSTPPEGVALKDDIVIGMKYLYSNMPYSDVGNYTFDTYLDYVQQGIYLWENSPYVKNYPELYFLNYVLFHRTNDEEIKPCRTYFWKKIKDKIGKSVV